LACSRGVYFQFGSVFIKKITKPNFFKKNRNRTETGSNRPVLVRFGFLEQNRFWLGFFGSAWFWHGLAWFFFPVFFGSRLKKNQNQTKPIDFFKILIGFFSWFSFFDYFFSGFFGLIDF